MQIPSISGVKSCHRKTTNTVLHIFDSEKSGAEPPERMRVPHEYMQVPPERSFAEVKYNFPFDTPVFMPIFPRQASSKEGFLAGAVFILSEAYQQFNADNGPFRRFRFTEALNVSSAQNSQKMRRRVLRDIPP
jgi:hypothetical protein